MRKQIKAHEERNVKTADDKEPTEPMPSYLLDRTESVSPAYNDGNKRKTEALTYCSARKMPKQSPARSRTRGPKRLPDSLYRCPRFAVCQLQHHVLRVYHSF